VLTTCFQDVLQTLYRDPHNIIIESDFPHIAPHIVISRVETTWDDFCIQSSVLPHVSQWDRLTVPSHTHDFRECIPFPNHHGHAAVSEKGNVVCMDVSMETNEQEEDAHNPKIFIDETPIPVASALTFPFVICT
jgi:hypothetical protein